MLGLHKPLATVPRNKSRKCWVHSHPNPTFLWHSKWFKVTEPSMNWECAITVTGTPDDSYRIWITLVDELVKPSRGYHHDNTERSHTNSTRESANIKVCAEAGNAQIISLEYALSLLIALCLRVSLLQQSQSFKWIGWELFKRSEQNKQTGYNGQMSKVKVWDGKNTWNDFNLIKCCNNNAEKIQWKHTHTLYHALHKS